MGACPLRVISFENDSVDSIGRQIKAVDMPDEFSEKPRILTLACENDAYPALNMAAQSGGQISPFARAIPVRCLKNAMTRMKAEACVVKGQRHRLSYFNLHPSD
jgi:quinone-modifying oxidoreductase subunit QmoB